MAIQLTNAQSRCIDGINDMINDFLMSIESVFSSPALGTVITGDIDRGTVWVGDRVEVIARDGHSIPVEIKEIIQEKQSVQHPEWNKSQRISLRLDLYEEDAIQHGDVVASWTSCGATPWAHDPPDGWLGWI